MRRRPRDYASLDPWEWPEGTGADLREWLEDPSADVSERLVAAELAGNVVVVDDDIARKLLEIANDSAESIEMRRMAVIALGPALEDAAFAWPEDLENPMPDEDALADWDAPKVSPELIREILASLRSLLENESEAAEVRRAALEASVHYPQDWHGRAVENAYDRDEPKWKISAVFAMGYVPGFEAQILEALDAENADLEYQAVIAAGQREIEDAWSHVHAILSNEEGLDKSLLLAAIEAAAAIRPEEALELFDVLALSENPDIQRAAEEAADTASINMMADDEFMDDEEDDDGSW